MKEGQSQKRGPGMGHVHQQRRRDPVDESALVRPQILVVVFPLMEIDLILVGCGMRIARNRCVLLLAVVEGSPSRSCVRRLTCGQRICISAGVGIGVCSPSVYLSPLGGGHDCFGLRGFTCRRRPWCLGTTTAKRVSPRPRKKSRPRGPLARTRKTRVRRENSCWNVTSCDEEIGRSCDRSSCSEGRRPGQVGRKEISGGRRSF